MRLALLFCIVCACAGDNAAAPPVVDVQFPEAGDAGGVIPFRLGGPFQVKVTGHESDLGKVSHATLEIVSGGIPPDATASTTITLSNQEDGTLAGTGTLKWPPGGPAPGELPLRIRVLVGSASVPEDVPLEHPELSVVADAPSNTGAQLVQSLCFQSTSTDGTLALHLTGGEFASGITEGTASLLPGLCSGALDPKNPTSFARVKVSIIEATAQVIATLPNTPATAVFESTRPPQGMLKLDLAASAATPPRESIVDLTVTAKVNNNLAKDIIVSFQSIPSASIIPTSVKTDATGRATASFQMPKEGSLRVTAISGDVPSNSLTFWP